MSHTLTAAQERRIRRVRRRENLRAGAYVAPTVVMLVLFFIVPIVLVVIMSISRWTLLGGNMGRPSRTTSSRSCVTRCSCSPRSSP